MVEAGDWYTKTGQFRVRWAVWLSLALLSGVGTLHAESPPVAKWIARGGGTLIDTANAVAVDGAGNVYFAGIFMTNATFGSTTLKAQVGSDLYLAKLDANGSYVWAKTIEPG